MNKMNNKILRSTILITLVVILLGFWIIPAFGACNPSCAVGKLNTNPQCACCGNCTLYDALNVGANLAKIILKYVGVITLALFIYGGIIWLTSGGSQNQIEKGKKIIVGTLVGLLIVLGAYLIVQTILKWVAPGHELTLRKEKNYNLLATDNLNKVIKYYGEKIL